MAELKARYGAPLVLLRPARLDRARRVHGSAPRPWTACSSASPKTASWPWPRSTRPAPVRRGPEPDLPPRRRRSCRIARTAPSPVSSTRRIPAWDLLDLSVYRLPLVNKPLRARRDVARVPVLVRLLRRADSPGSQVPREERQGARRRNRARLSRVRPDVLLPLGRHRHAERQDVQRVLRGTDRAQAARPVVRQRARRQPDRPGVRQAAASGRLLDAGARHRDRVRRDAQGHDEAARRREDPHRAARTCARPASGRSAFFILGYPGDDAASLDRTIDYAIDLDPDFANFYPAVPYPGTDLYAKAKRDGLLVSEDWTRMEYWYYLLRGNGLDEPTVMGAINRGEASVLPAPGVPGAPRRRRRAAGHLEVERALARRVAVDLRRAGHRHGADQPTRTCRRVASTYRYPDIRYRSRCTRRRLS